MLRIEVTNKGGRQKFDHATGPLEFGRGPRREPVARFTIADDRYVSKDHVRVEEFPAGLLRITNLSHRNPIWVDEKSTLEPKLSSEVSLPARLSVGKTTIAIDPGDLDADNGPPLSTIAEPVHPSGIRPGKPALLPPGNAPDVQTLTRWFETVLAVQRAAISSEAFYERTAQALIDLVGLDRGLFLLRRGSDRWEPAARVGKPATGPGFSRSIVHRVLLERRTFFQSAEALPETRSLASIEAVVASPIFDAQDQIIGILYGSRTQIDMVRGLAIGPLEAQIVQVLASAAGVGMARLEKEAEAGRLRIFEQFFSPSLAHELQRNPRLLEGQEREITVLFSDIRGFSRLSQHLAPQETCRLVREVMNELTEHVRAHDGVVVDYAGDRMMAMWNTPVDQPDHAALACRAALAIRGAVPRLSAAWSPRLGSPLEISLGLNTGPALVGNTGSTHKFKYGAMGHTVNLASRVEGATKYLGIPILVTGSTRAWLGDRFATRRLCKVSVAGFGGVVDLYELHAEQASPQWLSGRDCYEAALAQFEAGQWTACCKTISPPLLAVEGDHYDIPSLELAARAVECLKSPPKSFDPIVKFSGK
jgi:adenylate cyclase